MAKTPIETLKLRHKAGLVAVERFPARFRMPLELIRERFVEISGANSLDLWFVNGSARYEIEAWDEHGLICVRSSVDEAPTETPDESFHRVEHDRIATALRELTAKHDTSSPDS